MNFFLIWTVKVLKNQRKIVKFQETLKVFSLFWRNVLYLLKNDLRVTTEKNSITWTMSELLVFKKYQHAIIHLLNYSYALTFFVSLKLHYQKL